MLIWDDARHALGVDAMDPTHREFVALAAELRIAGSEDFPLLFDALLEHAQGHFDNESRLMRACRFPAIAEHEGEHRRVLGELARLREGIDRGRVAFARAYVNEGLGPWFEQHLATMDAALAGCLKIARSA
jgi:hemerythrin-like metal-binding protein